MPRQARRDAPDTLHHVMVRGSERTARFRDERDRADFVARGATLTKPGAWTVLAWALLPNHAHLWARTGSRPLARCLRSRLTGYAGTFNRRHRRTGPLFQNRYKSIVVEEAPYLLELVRYLHLTPVRAGVVLGRRARDLARATGRTRSNMTWAARQGAVQAAAWRGDIARWCGPTENFLRHVPLI